MFDLQSAELFSTNLIEVCFLKLGGTWDMVETDQGFTGTGRLDDKELRELESAAGFDEQVIFENFRAAIFQTQPLTEDISTHLSWAKDMGTFITGKFYPVFSGDSSNYRPSLLAAVINYICQTLIDHPNIPVIIGMGTDTTDILLPFLDVFLFDKRVPPVLVTGANRSHRESNSDAPVNFNDLAKIVHFPLPAGAYYVFNHTIYSGGDIVKIDPSEEPRNIEGLITFFAPHQTTLKISDLAQIASAPVQLKHAETLKLFTSKKLYEVMNSIVTIDLGDVNAIDDEVAKILSPKYPGVIIESHALGGVPAPIRKAVITAVKAGKLVLNVSRSLIGATNTRYSVSLLGINNNELLNEPGKVLNGGKLSQRAGKAILSRALMEGRGQEESQGLIGEYLGRGFEGGILPNLVLSDEKFKI